MKRSLKVILSALTALIVPTLGWAETLSKEWTNTTGTETFSGFTDAKWGGGDLTITVTLKASGTASGNEFVHLYNKDDTTSKFRLAPNGWFNGNKATYDLNGTLLNGTLNDSNTGGHFTTDRLNGSNGNGIHTDKAGEKITILQFELLDYNEATGKYATLKSKFSFPEHSPDMSSLTYESNGDQRTSSDGINLFGTKGYFSPTTFATGTNLTCMSITISGTAYVEPTVTSVAIDTNTASASTLEWSAGDPTNQMDATITASTATTLTLDEAITAHKLTLTGSDITLSGDSALTAGSTVIDVNTDTQSATNVTLGSVTINDGKTLTINKSMSEVMASASGDGTLKFVGGTAEEPLAVMGMSGKNVAIGAGHVAEATVANIAHIVTGESPEKSYYYFANTSNSFGLPAETNIQNVTLVHKTGTFWWECGTYTGTILQVNAAVTLHKEFLTPTIAGLEGAGNISQYNDEWNRTLTIDTASTNRETMYSGVLGSANLAVVVSGTGTQTFSGNNTYTLGTTISETATLKLVGSGKPGTGTVAIESGAKLLAATAEAAEASLLADTGTDTITLTNTITGAGDIVADAASLDLSGATLGTGYTGNYTVDNGGTLTLPTSENGKTITVNSGTLKLCVTQEQAVEGITVENVTLSDGGNITFVLPGGLEVEGSGTTLSAQNYYTYTATEATSSWETVGNWTLNGEVASQLPGADANVIIVAPEGGTTLTLSSEATVKSLTIQGGAVTLDGSALTTETLVLTTALTVNNALTIDAEADYFTEDSPFTLTATDLLTIGSTGTLTTKGYVDITGGVYSGEIDVVSGNLALSPTNTEGITGTLTIRADATFTNTRASDAINYRGNMGEIHIYGTLDLGDTRWTTGNTTINVYGGATITGTGDTTGALDYHTDANLNIKSDDTISDKEVTIDAVINTKNGGMLTINVDEGMSASFTRNIKMARPIQKTGAGAATISGIISGEGALTVASGTVALSGTNTYTGGTTIASGATLTITNAGALGTGTIAGAGTLECAGVLPTNTSGLNADTWTGTVKISNVSATNAGFNLPIYGNATSRIVFAGTNMGYLNFSTTHNSSTCTAPVEVLEDASVKIINGWGDGRTSILNKLTGSGIWTHNPRRSGGEANEAFNMHLQIKDVAEFAGSLALPNPKAYIFIGDEVANATGGNIILAAGETATIPAGMSWTVTDGKSVEVRGTIAGTGTLTGALTLEAGATWDMTDGVLAVDGVVTQSGALTIKTNAAADDTLFTGAEGSTFTADSITIADRTDVKAVVEDTAIKLATAVVNVCTGPDGMSYTTIQEAIDAGVAAGIKSIFIQLLANSNEAVSIPEGYAVSIGDFFGNYVFSGTVSDKNGNTLTADDYGVYTNIAYVASVTTGETVTKYATLADAYAAAVDGSTITITNPEGLELTSTWVVEKNIVLDLGKTTLSAAYTYSEANPAAIWVKNGGTLTIQNGTLSSAAEGIRLGVKGATDDTQAGTVVIEAGANVESSGDIGVLIYGGSSLTSAGNITSQATAAIQGNGLETLDTTIAITAGSVSSANDVAIYHPQPGTLTIGKEGGSTVPSIMGATGVEMRAGTLNMLSGLITTTGYGTEELSYAANGNGSTVTGAALAVSQHTTGKPITINITAGGSYNMANAFVLVNTTGNPSVEVTANLNLFANKNTAVILDPNYTLTSTTTGEEPNTVTTYSVEKAAAKIGTTGYPTLAAALEAVTTSEIKTITLLTKGDDGVTAVTIPTGVTLDIATPTMGASGQSATNVSFADGVTVTAEQGATVKLTSGGGYFSITGEGTVEAVGGDAFVYGMGSIKNTISANLVIPADYALNVRAWSNCAPLGGGNITVNGSIVENDGTGGKLAITVAEGKTLSGNGTISAPVTFAAGATIDATAGAVTVNGNVTLPTDGTVTVTCAAAAGTEVLACANATTLDLAKLSAAPEGFEWINDNGTIKLAAVLPPLVSVTIGEVTTAYTKLADALAALTDDATLTLLADVELTSTLVVTTTGVKIDLNGKLLKGTVAGTIVMNGGKYYSADNHYMAGPEGYYVTTDATFTFGTDSSITIAEGNVSISKDMNTLPNQTLTIAEGVIFTVPAEKTINVLGSTIIINGTLTINGTVKLGGTYGETTYTGGSITAAANLDITSGVDGYKVVETVAEGKYTYTLAEKPTITFPDDATDADKAAAIAAVQAVRGSLEGVRSITNPALASIISGCGVVLVGTEATLTCEFEVSTMGVDADGKMAIEVTLGDGQAFVAGAKVSLVDLAGTTVEGTVGSIAEDGKTATVTLEITNGTHLFKVKAEKAGQTIEESTNPEE